MVEKINLINRVPYPGESQTSYEAAMLGDHLSTCVVKINQLIDAVNTLEAEKKRVECERTSQGSSVVRAAPMDKDRVEIVAGSNPAPGNIKDLKLAESVINLQYLLVSAKKTTWNNFLYIKQVLTEKGLI